jgi:preprotein translocase subunit SecF
MKIDWCKFTKRFFVLFYFSLKISKLEADIQRLNQSIDKQKNSEIQLRTQLSDLKNVRKDLEDLRAENTALQTKYISLNFVFFLNFENKFFFFVDMNQLILNEIVINNVYLILRKI